MMRKPSCLISCSHWLPEGRLSVFVGRHGAMNPAGKVRCNMWRQIELCNGDCNFTTLRRKMKTPPRKGLTTEAGFLRSGRGGVSPLSPPSEPRQRTRLVHLHIHPTNVDEGGAVVRFSGPGSVGDLRR